MSRLETGSSAPDFRLNGIDGREHALSEMTGTPTVLLFERFASCPACNLTVRHYVTQHERLLQAGLRVFMLFHSPLETLIESMRTHQPPFVVLADESRAAYDAYGVESGVSGLLSPAFMARAMGGMLRGFAPSPWGESVTGVPAQFLVNEAGVLRLARYGHHAGDTPGPDELLRLPEVQALVRPAEADLATH